MKIADLPVEIQDVILSHLDAVSLEKSRQVCQTWCKLHEQLKYRVLWQKACLRDIPRDILLELLGCDAIAFDTITKNKCNDCGALNRDKKQSNNFVPSIGAFEFLKRLKWKDLYKEWYRSRRVGDWPHLVNSFQATSAVLDAKLSGDKIICGGDDGLVTVWDCRTAVCLKTLTGHLRPVVTIALRIKPGSCYYEEHVHDLIISGSVDTTVKVWSMEKGDCLATLRGHRSPVKCVAVIDHFAVSCANEEFIMIWNITQGAPAHTLTSFGHRFDSITLWEDKILTYTTSGMLHLWSLKTWQCLIKLAFPSAESSMLAGCVLRGNVVMALSSDGRIIVWELQSGSTDSSIDNFTEYTFSTMGPSTGDVSTRVCLAVRGPLVAMVTSTGAVFLYHIDGTWEKQFRQVKAVVHTGIADHKLHKVAISDNGEGPCLLTVSSDGLLQFYHWYPPSSTNIENQLVLPTAIVKKSTH